MWSVAFILCFDVWKRMKVFLPEPQELQIECPLFFTPELPSESRRGGGADRCDIVFRGTV